MHALTAPGGSGNLRLAGKNPELINPIKCVEVTEDRAKYDIDEGKSFAVEIGTRAQPGFKSREFVGQSFGLLPKRRLVRCQIESGNIVKHGGSELDPGA